MAIVQKLLLPVAGMPIKMTNDGALSECIKGIFNNPL